MLNTLTFHIFFYHHIDVLEKELIFHILIEHIAIYIHVSVYMPKVHINLSLQANIHETYMKPIHVFIPGMCRMIQKDHHLAFIQLK